MMAHVHGHSLEGTVLHNLREVQYKRTHLPLDVRVVSFATVGNMVLLGTYNHGCHVYSIHDNDIRSHCRLGSRDRSAGSRNSPTEGNTCYEICATDSHVAYIQQVESGYELCVHQVKDIQARKVAPLQSCQVKHKAPLVLESDLGILAIGGIAWKTSWTTGGSTTEEGGEDKVITVDLQSLKMRKKWKATENAILLLRGQSTAEHSMLGVADTRAGLKVYDLRQPLGDEYSVLYQVPVEEIRNFSLVGNFVAVFHKFEPNVSFWNMKEQKTILCINIQDQMKQLAVEFLEDEDDDSGLFEEDDDHVTSVTCMSYDQGHMLMYGTKSGCVFGIAVETRAKVFNVPFPHEVEEAHKIRKSMLGIGFIPRGKVVGFYEGHGLTCMDFSPEHPPDRPPTRGQMK